MRVLIVEDDEWTRLAFRSIFTRKGWEVSTAATVAQGFGLLASRPDRIILDLNLPDGRGEAILRKVRADDIPPRMVAVTTGVIDSVRLAVVMELRPDVLLTKPIDPDVVFRVCEAEMAESSSKEMAPCHGSSW